MTYLEYDSEIPEVAVPPWGQEVMQWLGPSSTADKLCKIDIEFFG